MDVMDDKRVGELWLELLAYREAQPKATYQSDRFIALIRKLVAERVIVNTMKSTEERWCLADHERVARHSLERALSDFGIDKETWK